VTGSDRVGEPRAEGVGTGPGQAGVACVIPAKDEAERIAATVTAVRRIDGVDLVVVVDDGSADGTARAAERAGAVVVRHERNRGKAAAMETGAAAVAEVDPARQAPVARDDATQGPDRRDDAGYDGRHGPRHLLFLDADLEETAANAAPLVRAVLDGKAELAIGILPRQTRPDGSKPGGHGFVVRLARAGIEAATGWQPQQPLSGQRCLTREAFEAARPLAQGFGVETSMIIDLRRKGFRIVEVPIELRHRASGTDMRGQLHRGRQFLHVARALASRGALTGALLRRRSR
jgi:glycosyltransferase involved in cell wall biosynthesis